MKSTSYTSQLQDTIQLLEVEQDIKRKLMKEDFHQAYESLKPVNIIQNALKEMSDSPYLADNLLSTTIGLAAGYVSKKVVVSENSNVFKKLLGVVLQFGVTNIIAKNPEAVRAFSQYISDHFFQKRK